MSANTSPYRKTAGSFVSDSNPGPIQQSLRLDLKEIFERNPYAMATHGSKTNFIVDSICSSALPEGPRAVAVSQTGEKHSLHLDESVFNVNNSNPFSVSTSANVTPTLNTAKGSTMTNISNLTDPSATNASAQLSFMSNSTSVTKIPSITIERPRLNSAKRSKGSRRYINQKPRPVFTPRNLEKILTPRINEELSKKPPMLNFNAQTQTDKIPMQPSHVSHHHVTTKLSTFPQPVTPMPPMPPMPPMQPMQPMQSIQTIQKRYLRENVGDMLKIDPSRNIEPLRVVPPRTKSKMRDFSELRNIASALTLITVVSWLFSTFFELDGINEIFNNLANLLQSWFAKKEQPITKAEMLVQYVRDWWP